MSDAAISSQALMQAATDGTPVSATSQLAMLAAYAPPSTFAVRTAMSVMQASTEGTPVSATSQAVMLVAYVTGPIENLKVRAWSFTLDGHTFYALTLGEQGTYVYDMITEQWSRWRTAGLTGWNVENGTTWKTNIIGSDQSNPIIWEVDPNSFLDDDFKPITRIVTGGIPLRLRTFAANYSFRIVASLGRPDVPVTAPPTVPTVTLEYSDDQGETYVSAGSIEREVGKFTQELQWLSLGVMQAPQRVFRVTDVGAIVRLDSADTQHDQGE